jgi:methionyl-tRNA formyltransferase
MITKTPKQPSLILLGQCSFTCHILKNLIEQSRIPSFVAIEDEEIDNDPFKGLVMDSMPEWFSEHLFYHYNWKEDIKALCEEYSIPHLFQKEVIGFLPLHKVLIVAGYSKKIPKFLLDTYKKWTINIHPSMLPMYKGPQPEAQIILNNANKYAGVTLHRLTDSWDSGEIYFQKGYDNYLFYNVGQMESIGAKIAVEGIESLLRYYPNVKGLDIINSSNDSYYTWYNEADILNINYLDINDSNILNKLRLRPEGYAFIEKNGLTIYPIVDKHACSERSDMKLSIVAVIVKKEPDKELIYVDNKCIRFLKGLEIWQKM